LSLTAYQHDFFETCKSNKKISARSTKLIKAGWHLIHKVWQWHNKQLQETNKITELEGVPLLNQIIEEERNFGLHNLPALEFSNMFHISKENLQKKSIMFKKGWLATVKKEELYIMIPNSLLTHLMKTRLYRNG
jgi:hypothetical protein